MRLLETFTANWKMETVHEQINAFREAFSADISKPFELKPELFGSPMPQAAELPLLSPVPTPTYSLPHDVSSSYGPPAGTQMSYQLGNSLTPNSVDDEHVSVEGGVARPNVGRMAHPSSSAAPPLMQQQWNPSRLWE
jgi:hypothetical protein